MEVAMVQYPPGDPRLVDKIVGQLKSQGIFDRFRKECIADVDTKPAYQNLHQRVETSVSAFLAQQEWKSDLNKNQVRDSLRKHIHESGFLDIGVERIVDQVVNPKIMPVFLPQIEDVVYSCLGIEKPKRNKEIFNVTMCPPPTKQPPEKKPEPLQVLSEMLPKDLDPISPESDTFKDDDNDDDYDYDYDEDDNGNDNEEEFDNNDDELDKSKVTEEEESSPPFEPIEKIHSNHGSNDSHLSDISGLSSVDSQISDISFSGSKKDLSTPKCPVSDLVSQDSQLSKVSSDSRLSMESSKILADDNKEEAFSHISEDSSKQKFEGITSFSQQHIFSHSPHMTEEHQDKSKDGQINEEILRNRHSQSNTDSNVNKLQKCEFDFADSASMQTEETAKSSIDGSDSKSHLCTGIESCDVSESELLTAKPKSKVAIFSSIFKDNKSENQDILTNKSGNDYSWDNNLKRNYNKSLEVCEQRSMVEKHADGFGEDNVSEILCSEGNLIIPTPSDFKQKNMISDNSMGINFKNEDTESSMLKDNSLDGYSKIRENIQIKSDTQCETDTDTKDSQSLIGTHDYDSIQEPFNTNDSQLLIGNFKDHEGDCKNIVSMNISAGGESKESKQYIKEGHSLKQLKSETETKNDTDMSLQKGSSFEEVSVRKESMKEPLREHGKKEHYKDNSHNDKYVKDGTKERSRSEKEIAKDRKSHDKFSKDSSKEHMKHDDRRAKEGSKDYSKRDDSRERNRQNERKERSKRDDKEISKDKHKHEEKSDRERSRHDSKSERDKIRDYSRYDEKSDRNINKDRKEGGKDSSRRDKTRDDKSYKASEKDKGKQEEKSDKYKTKLDEKSKFEKEKTRNENSSSKPTNQDAEQKEKHKSDSKRSKDKYKYDKSKHGSDGKSRKSADDKSEKEITNKEDQKEKLRDQHRTDSGESAEKSHKDKQRIHEKNEKDRKSHDKSRESSSSSSSRKSDRKGENSKSQKNESKDKEKKKENKSKSVPDDHFVHRDKNSEDRRSTDRDSNGTSCDKSRGKATESQSSQKQEKKSSRRSGTGKTEGGVSESQDTNAKSEECDEGDSPSKSPESSPPSLLPLKKRPLQHSETDDEVDEYSCSNDSGKLVLKLKKPKIAANIFEIKKIMQLRKSMAKIENRNRYHNGKHSEIKEQAGKQQNDTELLDAASDKERELQSCDPVNFQIEEGAIMNDEDKVVSQEGVSFPSREPVLQNVKQNTHMNTNNETVSGSGFKPKDEDSHNKESGDYENSDIDGEVTHFEEGSALQIQNLSTYISTYEENLYSNPVCFTDCSDSDDEETSTSHSLSHLKCKVVKEILDEYVRQHFGIDSDLTISVTEAYTAVRTSRPEAITGETNDIPTSSNSNTKDIPDGTPKKARRTVDSSGIAHSQSNKNIIENSQSSSEFNCPKFPGSATNKKLPKGYVLEWVPVTTTDMDNSNNNAVHSRKRYLKRNGGTDKEKSNINVYNQISAEQKTEECTDKIPPAPTENPLEGVSSPGSLKEVHEIPHLNSGTDNSLAVNCTSNNGPQNRYVIADSDEDEYVGDEKSNVDNNIDKSSSDDEKVPLSADLIFHSLRDLMLESGMQKQISPDKVIGITENLPKPTSEPRRNLLGRSRRPGLGRPAPGKGVVVDNSNSRTSTPDFVMPLSPESDVSASSGEQNKKLVDSREAGNIADSDVDTENLNQEDSEGKRTLRSATTAYRGQRYSSDELYKPRPLFNVTSRRAKSKQQSPPPSAEVTVKKRRSTVEECESSHSEKGTYR